MVPILRWAIFLLCKRKEIMKYLVNSMFLFFVAQNIYYEIFGES